MIPLLLLCIPISISTILSQIDIERRLDYEYHSCRSCREISIRTDENCPQKGFECDPTLAISTNVLTPENGRCVTLQCQDKAARLVSSGKLTDKIRCKNNEWVSNDGRTVSRSAICAKACDQSVCAQAFPGQNNYDSLDIVDGPTGCASTKCTGGFAVLEDDGTFDYEIPKDQLSIITCSGDGKWNTKDGRKAKYVMCLRKEECGAGVCPLSHPTATGVEPMTESVQGDNCAVATCEEGYSFAILDDSGSVLRTEEGKHDVVCTKDGKWEMDGEANHKYIMCQKKEENECGAGVCPLSHPKATGFEPMTETVQGDNCAIGTCKEGHNVAILMDDGSLLRTLEGDEKFKCTKDRKWKAVNGGADFDHVMCQKKDENAGPCKSLEFELPHCPPEYDTCSTIEGIPTEVIRCTAPKEILVFGMKVDKKMARVECQGGVWMAAETQDGALQELELLVPGYEFAACVTYKA